MCYADPSRDAADLATKNTLFRDTLRRTMKPMLLTFDNYGSNTLTQFRHAVFDNEWIETVLAESARRVTQRTIRNGNLRWEANDIASIRQIGSPSTPS